MFLPVSTEAHDGRIRMGSLGIVLLCVAVHIFASLDAGRRAGDLGRLEAESERHAAAERMERRMEKVMGEGELAGTLLEADAEEAAEARAALDEVRRETLTYRLGLVPGDFNLLNLVTHQFAHADWLHLLFNLWFFWIVGVTMEKFWGLGRFLGIYLGCGAAGALAFLLLSGPRAEGIPLVGASGAIAGMMGAFAVTHGDAKVRMIWLFGLRGGGFSVPAIWYLGFWLAGQAMDAVLYAGQAGGVAYTAHIGGFLAGLLAGRLVPGDAFYAKAYTPEFGGAAIKALAGPGKLVLPQAPPPQAAPDGSDLARQLDRGDAAAAEGDTRAAGASYAEAMEWALTRPGLPAKAVEACVTRLLGSLHALDLPPGALYAWGRRMEQKDWWAWAVALYDAAAADFSPGTSAHSRGSSLLRAAVLRLDHGRERDKAILGLEAVLQGDIGGPLAEEAAARLAGLGRPAPP